MINPPVVIMQFGKCAGTGLAALNAIYCSYWDIIFILFFVDVSQETFHIVQKLVASVHVAFKCSIIQPLPVLPM